MRRIAERFHIDIKPALLNEFLMLNAFAILIGMASGLLALAFRYLIWGVHSLYFNQGILRGFITRSDIIKAHRKKMEEEGLAAPSKGS